MILREINSIPDESLSGTLKRDQRLSATLLYHRKYTP